MDRTDLSQRQRGGTLALTLIVIALLTLIAAHTLRRVEPKLRMAYQTAGWQEARAAAEAGIDVAVGELSRNAVGANPGTWTGWKQQSGGVIGPVLATTLGTVNSVLSLLGGTATVSQPIFLDNLKVSAATGFDSEVDVQLWAVYPNGSPNGRWFRLRAMATCALPPPTYTAPDALDAPLRRYSLRTVRPQLKKNDVGEPMSISTPSASRTIEVLVEPILAFELAIFTGQELSLGTSGTWSVDSYDSRDPLKSNPDGTYSSAKAQENGSVASNLVLPVGTFCGPLIAARGTRVRGTVATNGGDDPSTADHENVSGGINLDPARIRGDFHRDMPSPERPNAGLFLPTPLLGLPFLAGPEGAPAQYIVAGNLGLFSVAATPGVRSAITILVNGDLDVWGELVIPPEVTAQIYVRGDIDFHDSVINSGAASSRRPAQLQIFGEDSHGDRRTLRANGSASICAAFYGPGYDIRLTDNVEWFGAVAGRTFEMLGGAAGAFHYDEALGTVGNPISFRIARYVEDVRE
ncbi:MAG: pilus assembly PilX N-terminal domain-containing protein [Chthoniobacteraceae bacterium]